MPCLGILQEAGIGLVVRPRDTLHGANHDSHPLEIPYERIHRFRVKAKLGVLEYLDILFKDRPG
jgi:hypothetical protein